MNYMTGQKKDEPRPTQIALPPEGEENVGVVFSDIRAQAEYIIKAVCENVF